MRAGALAGMVAAANAASVAAAAAAAADAAAAAGPEDLSLVDPGDMQEFEDMCRFVSVFVVIRRCCFARGVLWECGCTWQLRGVLSLIGSFDWSC